jgi:hypothetical protein
MRKDEGFAAAASSLLDADEVEGVLAGAFYSEDAGRARAKALRTPPRPDHYKVICISLYNEDLTALDAKVDELKSRGFTKANRSALIRAALEAFDLDTVKRGL